MKLAYIAGPFRAANAWQRAQNIREAEQVGMDVAEHLGVQPVIPHSNTGNFDGTLDDAFWLEGTKEMMRRCDMVVCTERWHASTGAKDEVKEAHRLNIPAYVKIGACYYPILNDGFPALGQRLDPWELKAIIEADWKREITIDPSTNSISATLAACSAPVPEILSRMCTANQRVTVEARADGMPVYKVPESLRDVTVEELARLGLRPSQPTQYEMRCGKCDRALHIGTESDPEDVFGEDYDRQPCWLCGESLLHVTVREQKGEGENPSQPEPPPTGDGASALRPRPFWWDSSAAYGSVGNGGDFQMDLKYLLECAPTALDAHESFQPCDPRDYPTFGIGPEFTGPRTLREYLEATDAPKTA